MQFNAERAVSSRTFEGAPAIRISPEQELERAVVCSLLGESTCYEGGSTIMERIDTLVGRCSKEYVNRLAVRTRKEYNIRHTALWLLVCAAKHKKLDASTVAQVISRADEPGELLAQYWKDGKKPIPAAFKK